MDYDKYEKIYKKLGIDVELPSNYDPDTYGRSLLEGISFGNDISYSNKTECTLGNQEEDK